MLPGNGHQYIAQVVAHRLVAAEQLLLSDWNGGIGNDLGRVYLRAVTKAVTGRARSVRTVERKRPRLDRRHRYPAFGTSHSLGVQPLFAIDDRDKHQAGGQFRGRGDRVFQSILYPRLYQQAVDDDFDGVIAAFVQLDVFVQLPDLAVDPGPGEP